MINFKLIVSKNEINKKKKKSEASLLFGFCHKFSHKYSMSQKKRKYLDNYLDFGFTYLIQDGLQISQCVLCNCMKIFSNSTMKPPPLNNT